MKNFRAGFWDGHWGAEVDKQVDLLYVDTGVIRKAIEESGVEIPDKEKMREQASNIGDFERVNLRLKMQQFLRESVEHRNNVELLRKKNGSFRMKNLMCGEMWIQRRTEGYELKRDREGKFIDEAKDHEYKSRDPMLSFFFSPACIRKIELLREKKMWIPFVMADHTGGFVDMFSYQLMKNTRMTVVASRELGTISEVCMTPFLKDGGQAMKQIFEMADAFKKGMGVDEEFEKKHATQRKQGADFRAYGDVHFNEDLAADREGRDVGYTDMDQSADGEDDLNSMTVTEVDDLTMSNPRPVKIPISQKQEFMFGDFEKKRMVEELKSKEGLYGIAESTKDLEDDQTALQNECERELELLDQASD